MVPILVIPANMATLGFLKIKVFWNKGYDVVILFRGGIGSSSIIWDWH